MSPVSVSSYSSESGKVRTRTAVVGSMTVLLVFLAIVLLSDSSLSVISGVAKFAGMFLAPV